MAGTVQDVSKTDDGLYYLKGQIDWCLSQYECPEEIVDDQDSDQSYLPDWAAFRTLENNLHGVLLTSEPIKVVSVASMLISVFHRSFGDLCSDTPWDKDQLINRARKQLHKALFDLLVETKKGLEDNSTQANGALWVAFSSFEYKYNKILCDLNKEDQIAIEAMVSREL